MIIGEIENLKVPKGEVTLIGLGRLGMRTALHLIQAHRGGPKIVRVFDGQKISADDLIFRNLGGIIGEYKVDFLKRMTGPGFSRDIIAIPENISETNLSSVSGDVVCIEIAGGDTLPTTGSIIQYAQKIGATTMSTMGVFGIGVDEVKAVIIEKADQDNPIVSNLWSMGIRNHLLVGTGKLIRDWEPVTPYVLDKISQVMTAEILKNLHQNAD